jgi:glycine dehydrogenase subunit 2
VTEPLLSEYHQSGRRAVQLPAIDVPLASLPPGFERSRLPLPELTEPEVLRHYTRLAHTSLSNMHALQSSGSCTVKYNPVVNEEIAALPGFAQLHPLQPIADLQGALHLIHELGSWLTEITGLPTVSLQPAAGAQAQLAGLLMIRLFLRQRGDAEPRDTVLVTATAHGSNPASAAMAGFKVVTIPHDARGNVDLAVLRASLSSRVAAFMLTNPNTLGLFEEESLEIARLVHASGALLFADGANLNAIVGKLRLSDLGVDVTQLNIHKTFSTPHGGNGPGAGALLACAEFEPYLPTPVVVRRSDGSYDLSEDRPLSIGRVRSFYGQFAILVRGYAYILAQGPDGLRRQAEDAVLHANYVLRRLRETYRPAYERAHMHEFIVSAGGLGRDLNVRDVASRLMDHGFQPPNLQAGRVVEAGMLVEPTETETKQSLDAFADALLEVAREAREAPEVLRSAPHTTPVGRLTPTRPGGVPDVAAGIPLAP